ncbi:hypothetical protein [Paeniglutamicibacter cryotolerans]|uniref:Uncharacterized protein n=1 Tax=Paeniglutamicibacter cryotolerans TaxID=670079 RepID=A0A839QHC6_9MICC|nr:hypothetical protein [Paeniglutamicibacter cryotolerans]MBB2994144.1 hypothetical protein [Paeniglutamicibacter cryotolerans]
MSTQVVRAGGLQVHRVDHFRRRVLEPLRHWVVGERGDNRAHDPRNVGTIRERGHRPGVYGLGEEGDLHETPIKVGGQRRNIPGAIASLGVVQCRNINFFLGDEVAAHEVDGAPRDGDHRQPQGEVLEVGEEVLGCDKGDDDWTRNESHEVGTTHTWLVKPLTGVRIVMLLA